MNLDNDFEFSQCCFCKEKYLSEACRECPARDADRLDAELAEIRKREGGYYQ